MKLNRRSLLIAIAVALFLFVGLGGQTARALTADQILLIVNKNSPDSQKLAAVYAQLRGVPAGQVVSLDLPNDEEMPFETYEAGMVGPVRQFLVQNHLRDKIKCLLTFYGVPFRIKDKHNSPSENIELAELRGVLGDATSELSKVVEQQEQQASRLDPSFSPGAGDTMEALLARSKAAITAASGRMQSMADRAQATLELRQLLGSLEVIGGVAELDSRLGASQRDDPGVSDAQKQKWAQIHDGVMLARGNIEQLQGLRWDAQARSELRLEARKTFGIAGLIRVVQAQIEYLTPGQTGAATDNELALLWWDVYSRNRWVQNPLMWSFVGQAPRTLMVMRLDGPDPKTVEKMMRTSVEVEKTGLKGIIAIDARGLPPIDAKGNLDAFGEFDETLRHLAEVVRLKTSMRIRLDDQDMVFPAHSVKNVALYVGWYSVQNYIPGCDFNPGAVGYHIASYELITLHTPSSRWVRGLLTDGVVATLGPVAEPYLSAFPKPDEFFPLLLTGKLSMAEVYWKTTPMTSWMISFIGDPLYTPYKSNPELKVEDLPPGLRRAFRGVQ